MDTRIVNRLRAIQPVQLQALAEQLALVLRPKTFSRAGLVIRGRNIEAQTTKGWPDAYAQATDGRIFAIEATRDKASWKTHIQQDYDKAKDKKNHDLAGYFFVGGYPNTGPSDADGVSGRS